MVAILDWDIFQDDSITDTVTDSANGYTVSVETTTDRSFRYDSNGGTGDGLITDSSRPMPIQVQP